MKKLIYISLISVISEFAYSQVDATNHVALFNTWYVGWDNSAQSNLYNLNVEHKGTQNINFFTGPTQRMTILGTNAGASQGFVGIGVITPGWQLDVDAEINIKNPTFRGGVGSYMLDEITILDATATNLMVGWNAGIATTTTAIDNTFVGFNAGLSNASSDDNTFIGKEAGKMHTTNSCNTFVGWHAGKDGGSQGESTYIGALAGESNDNGGWNVFLGTSAGQQGITGFYNVFLGALSGRKNTANHNLFIGYNAGYNNTSETPNTFIGNYSGYQAVDGDSNTFLGYHTGYYNQRSNNVFIGNVSGENNIVGRNNSFLGSSSGNKNIDGGENTFLGYGSGFNNVDASRNTFTGANTGFSNVNGEDNTFFGFNAGFTNDNAEQNTFVGSNSGFTNADGINNAYVGFRSGFTNDRGNANALLGSLSGENADADSNVAVGYRAGHAITVNNGVFVGNESGLNNTTGIRNSFFGASSGKLNVTGSDNTFLGYYTGFKNTGSFNSFAGSFAGVNNISGTKNSFLGYRAGFTNDTGNENVFVGNDAAYSNKGGKENTIIGTEAGFTGDKDGNTFIGYKSGRAFNTGTHNVYVGHSAGLSPASATENTLIGYNTTHTSGISNSTAIGNGADVVTNNDMILGNNSVNVGIGLSGATFAAGPVTKLQVNETTTQLRLSYNYNTIYSDFETNSNGYLRINPSGSRAGINLATGVSPSNTLEIRKGTTGLSGLRFTDMNSGSSSSGPSSTASNSKVLAVDGSGDVILVDDVGGGDVIGSCSNHTDYIPRYDNNTGKSLGCSDIINKDYGTGNNRIGFYTATPIYKFHMEGGSSFFSAPGSISSVSMSAASPPAVVVNSNQSEGLSILHTAAGVKDRMKIFGDANVLYHLQMYGNGNGNGGAGVHPGSMTFENFVGGTAPTTTSWLGFNSWRGITMFKSDFNTAPNAPNTGIPALTFAGNSTKVYIESQNVNTNYPNNDMVYGLVVNNSNTSINPTYTASILGYNFTGRNGDRVSNRGGMFWASGATGNRSSNIGVQGNAIGTGANSNAIGGQFIARGGNINYGIISSAPITPPCTGGAGGACANAAGYFNGYVFSSGGALVVSDTTLKTSIAALGANSLLDSIKIYSFNFDTTNTYGINLPGGTHYGVKAHELKAILPSLVQSFNNVPEVDTSGNPIDSSLFFKAVDYTGLIPLLIKGYQNQAQKIDSLTDRLDTLEVMINNCCNLRSSSNQTQTLSVELVSTNAIILNQNEPNPFTESTVIKWNIPEQEFKGKELNAMLMFYDNSGTILKSVKINSTGEGSLTVFSSKLSSGIYSYTLVVNGKAIDTKRMVKTN